MEEEKNWIFFAFAAVVAVVIKPHALAINSHPFIPGLIRFDICQCTPCEML